MRCRKEARFYTEESVLDAIRAALKNSGHIPVRRELQGISSACQKFFGSWNKAIIAAGLMPKRSHSQRMYKRINTRAKDGHLCDSVSEMIIDNWLFKYQIFHQRNVPYPTTGHRADWGVVFNGVRFFIEYFGLVNDSPRYDREINKKKELCQKNNVPLIDLYPSDLYPRERLITKLGNLIQ